jgi:hypothetical protein
MIASDPRERGNPTKSLRGLSPWQPQEFPRFARDKASVFFLPRNDMATQSRRGERTDFQENLLQLFEAREYAKLGFDEKDFAPPRDFWNHSPPCF